MHEQNTIDLRLPAFGMGFADLKKLFEGLQTIFPDGNRISITVPLSADRSLRFESVEEFMQCDVLPTTLRDVRIHASDPSLSKSLMLRTRSFTGGLGQVSASGPDRAWCLGAASYVFDFFNDRRRWYWPLVSGKATAAALMMFSVAFGFLVANPDLRSNLILLLCASFALMFLGATTTLFPPATIRTCEPDRFFKRWAPEITALGVAITIVGVLVAILK